MDINQDPNYNKPINHLLTAQLGLAEGLIIAAETAAKNGDFATIDDLIDYLTSSVFLLDYTEIDFIVSMREYFDALIYCVKNDLNPIEDKETMRSRNSVVQDMIDVAQRYKDPTYTLWSSSEEYNGLLASFDINQSELSKPYKESFLKSTNNAKGKEKKTRRLLWFAKKHTD